MELSKPLSTFKEPVNESRVYRGHDLDDLQAITASDVNAVVVNGEQRSHLWTADMEAVSREILSVMKAPFPITIGKEDDAEIAVAEFDSEWDLKSRGAHAFYQNIIEVIRTFQKVVQSDEIGLRIDAVDSDNCSNFHVDLVPLRLVMTLLGPGTQWLANGSVDRLALRERRFNEICRKGAKVEQVLAGEVLLMKGEGYSTLEGERNVGNGFVHRSPPKSSFKEPRLLLRIDEISERQHLNIGRF